MDSTQAIDSPVDAEESIEPESQAFLAKADEADWLRLFEHCVSIPFRAGDEIIRQGDGGQSLFIVAEGELESIILNEDEPHTVQLALMPAQSVFGEQAFFDGQPRSATIRARTDGQLLELTMERFEKLGVLHPRLARMVLFDLGRIISLRLRATTKVFVETYRQ
ncbi:MAG: cyclic nucleotide-binding domain-containing protein [Betaproteobacteria bacterium]|nr:cyclic nucleotide-binding domain-containing protein [Betaproteobacteria bacterium]